MIFKEINCDSSSSKDRKIQPLDLTKRKSRELEKQQADTVSRKLDGISPSMYRTYEWVLRQNDPSLSGKDLEKAIWMLHEYRQKKGSIPDKTMVAPDKSDAQMLVGQASHWSSSDTLVSSDKVQTESQDRERLKEKLRESLRSVVQEYRQEGNVRSTAPALRNMTEGQILLEVLSHPDGLNRLQERGIELNVPVLRLMYQTLKGMKSLIPSEHNPAVRNFMETLDKLKSKDLTALQVEPVGLRGGACYVYDRRSQQYYGRIMTLVDPEGNSHIFACGEHNVSIAKFTAKKIERYKIQYAQRCREHWTGCGYSVTDRHIAYYKDQYKKGKALTTSEVMELEDGEILHGWACTKLEFPLQQTVYCTDKGTEINALDLSTYKSRSREEQENEYPSSTYTTLKDPTPTYNCHGNTFIDGQAWLLSDLSDEIGKNDAIPRILKENEYHSVSEEQAQVGDIVVYRQGDGSISHTATVIGISPDRQSNKNNIKLKSKPGYYGIILHNMNDNIIMKDYGRPFIYHTDRKNGHKLYTKEEWQILQAQAEAHKWTLF